MNRLSPNREASVSAPADRQSFSPAVPPHGSDKAADLSPWPVADTPGRPFIHPHRLAQAMGDRDATYERHEQIRDRLYTWVITISATLMGVVLLAMAIDRFLDGKF